MTEHNEPTESIEEPEELTEQDIADLEILNGEPPQYHTILEVWREVLQWAPGEAEKKVQAGWAAKMTQTYQQLKIQDMNTFRDLYFGKIVQLYNILLDEISTDKECLSYTDPKDDTTENAVHYKNLLLLWQTSILQWEIDWDCADENAHIEIAAIAEAQKIFFGENGIANHLSSVGFEYTEADQAVLTEALEELRGTGE